MAHSKNSNGRGLSQEDRVVIDRIAQKLGYDNLHQLVVENGCRSASQLVGDFHFTSVRDFFIGDGWYDRVEPLRKTKTAEPESINS